jgi:hypothetical protein
MTTFSVNMEASDIDSGGTANANILRRQFDARHPDISVKPVGRGESILIVGAGAFGSSLALELVTRHHEKSQAMK